MEVSQPKQHNMLREALSRGVKPHKYQPGVVGECVDCQMASRHPIHIQPEQGQVSVLNDRERKACTKLSDALTALSNLYPNQRKKVYKRLEMLKVFTPQVTEIFEQNLKRITKSN